MSVWDHYFTQAALGAGARWWKSDQSAGCMQLYCSAGMQYSAAVLQYRLQSTVQQWVIWPQYQSLIGYFLYIVIKHTESWQP